MQNVSFRSNYSFGIGDKYPDDVMNQLCFMEFQGASVATEFPTFEESCKTGVFEKVYASVPDNYDKVLETLLLSRGIKFRKQSIEEAMNLDNIKNRINLSKDDVSRGKMLIEFDTNTLNELFKQDGISYIEKNGKNSIGNRYENVGKYLQTGRNINATSVNIYESDGKLHASINDGRHRFAYMRDLGMKSIPVSIDKVSYNIAQKYNLV